MTRVGTAWKDRTRRRGWGPRALVRARRGPWNVSWGRGRVGGDREQVVGSWAAAPLDIEEVLELEP